MKTIIELQNSAETVNIQYFFHDDLDEHGQQTVDMTVDSEIVTELYHLPVDKTERSDDLINNLYMVDGILERAWDFYVHKFFDAAELAAILSITEYELDLFGAETYNGWDYDGLAEDLDMTYQEAVVHTALYCIGKIKLEIFLRESE